MKALILTVLLFLSSCERNSDEENTIVGNWQLTEIYKNNNPIGLKECQESNSINIADNSSAKFISFTKESNICTENINGASLTKLSDHKFMVRIGYPFNDTDVLELDGNTLYYKWKFVNYVNGEPSTTSYVEIYKRK